MLTLLQYLQSIHPIGPEAQAMIASFLKEQVVLRGRHWLQQGAVCDKIAFIEKGLVRVYTDSGSKDVCLWYNRENEVMLSVYSFFSQTPSQLAIQAMEDTKVFYITYQQLQQVYEKHVDFNVNGRRILEHYYSLSELHVRILLLPTDERIKQITKLYPWLLTDSRITNKMLAAYIGVTPEYLSKFRNRRMGKGERKAM